MADETHSLRLQQEDDRPPVKRLLAIAALSAAVMLLAVIGSDWLLVRAERDFGAKAQMAPLSFPGPGPRAIAGVEQTDFESRQRGQELNAAARRTLSSWGWADQARGVATIPIERAFEVLIREEGRH
jgi:hypothetical protein